MLPSDLVVTIVPETATAKAPENLTKFRWNMNLGLPYPFPVKACVRRPVEIAGKPFSFEIHNHFDRVIQTVQATPKGPRWLRAFLVDKRQPTPAPTPECVSVQRQQLPSVVFFDGQTDFPTPSEAFAGARDTIQSCLEWLNSFLAAVQREAPYLVSSQVYPITLFDVPNVYHEVRAYCTTHSEWHLYTCAIHSSLGAQRQHAAFVMEPPTTVDSTSPLDTANELLAEAQMSLIRGMPRLSVLNAYTAVESLANAVFTQTKVAKLVAHNVPAELAGQLVEEERDRHKTEPQFLYHRGIKSASGRSILDENKQLYDGLLQAQKMRHRVAHTGYKPTPTEARDLHKLCCEAAQWFAAVAGLPVKPLLPAPEDSAAGIVAEIAGGCQFAMSVEPTTDVGDGKASLPVSAPTIAKGV